MITSNHSFVPFLIGVARGGREHLAVVPVQQRQRLRPLPPAHPHRGGGAERRGRRGGLLGLVLVHHDRRGRLRVRHRLRDWPADPGWLI